MTVKSCKHLGKLWAWNKLNPYLTEGVAKGHDGTFLFIIMLQAGIVGILPNVGKSTLFNALTKTRKAEAANYPFCTIDPNVGVVQVPDSRLEPLAKLVSTSTIIPAAIEMVDIAGLVEGASKGEGLGNKFWQMYAKSMRLCMWFVVSRTRM